MKLGRAFAFLMVLASGPACFTENDGKTCDDFCQLAVRCGLLPSPLGSGDTPEALRQSCGSRCRLSDEPSFRAVTKCQQPGAPDAALDDLWCSNDRPVCAALDTCLAESFPEAEIAGLAALDVKLASTDTLNTPASCPSLPQVVTTPLKCSDDVSPLVLQAVTIVVAQRSLSERLAPLSCSLLATSAVAVEGLHAGPAQVAAEVTATGDSLTAPLCRLFEANPVVLQAGKRGLAQVPVPLALSTFSAGAPCTNPSTPDAGAKADGVQDVGDGW